MIVGDRVSITDPQNTHEGTVTTVKDDGMLTVKWDSGMTERVHESELTLLGYQLGAPLSGGPPANRLAMEQAKIQQGLAEAVRGETVPMPNLDDDDGYDQDDPKHPSFRERLAAWWDAR